MHRLRDELDGTVYIRVAVRETQTDTQTRRAFWHSGWTNRTY